MRVQKDLEGHSETLHPVFQSISIPVILSDYIRKVQKRGAIGKKRKSAKC
jgi:hypothetical protein